MNFNEKSKSFDVDYLGNYTVLSNNHIPIFFKEKITLEI